MGIALKRAYDPPSPSDGVRVLVERLWPRGLTREQARIDEWLKDVAPSTELRKWFHAQRDHWATFRKRYLDELSSPAAAEALDHLYTLSRSGKNLTLIYGSRDTDHNGAVILKELLEGMRKPPTGTGPVRSAAKARVRMQAK